MAGPARDGVRLDTLQPASPQSEFFRAEGPHEPKGADEVELAVGLGLEYAKAPLRAVAIDEQGNERALAGVVDHAVFARIGASITPISWLSFEMTIPFALFQAGAADQAFYGGEQVLPTSPQGIGDLLVGLQLRPVDTGPFDLLVGGRFWAPIGSAASYMSDHRFRAEASLGAAGQVGPLLYGCSFSVAPGFFAKRDGDRLAASCGAHARVLPVLAVGLEPSFALVQDTLQTDEPASRFVIEPLAAAKLSVGPVRIGLGAGPSFGSAPGAAEVRVLLSLAFLGVGGPEAEEAAKITDRDLDEILDENDACPAEAGPRSRDKARNGCPMQDRDADGIRDADDFCPDRPGVADESPQANGCPDSDNDEVLDPLDKCPNEPGTKPAGCPKYARLTGGTFKITPPIEFKDTTLSPEGVAALLEIAATMRANPKFEQVSISLGTRGVRTSTSDQRAEQLILIFRNGNLDSDRYEVVLKDDQRGGTVQAKLVR
jgi:hypothetical protein